ncbi:MAG TPA: phospholipase A [Nitrospirota bacterium]|nr:phospholipase A [Nitrospirota bacterium]
MTTIPFVGKALYPGFILLFLSLAFSLSYTSDAFAEASSGPTSTLSTKSDNVISAPIATTNPSSNPTTTAPSSRGTFIFQPYKPMYAIVAYDRSLGNGNNTYQDWELQFQLSLKMPVMTVPWQAGVLALAYTQVSFWQAFNGNQSSPFRETNYAPEIMMTFDPEPHFLDVKKMHVVMSVIHQSNGEGGQDSRSWNRVYGEIDLAWDHLTLGLKPWYRIPERSKSSPSDARGDDNPDIERYMGYGELTAGYNADWWALLVTIRNNLRASPNNGSTQIELTIPMKNDVSFYVQVFDGYGLSLIDYNRYSRRVGVGFVITRLPMLW